MKKTNRVSFFWMVALVGFFLFTGGVTAFAKSETVYTKYNIHAQEKGRSIKASYANYTNPGEGHLIIPRGSKITILKKNRKRFIFKDEKTQKKITFDYHAGRMGMKINDYIALITSPTPVSNKDLSKIDLKGIKKGKALKGMTREGVKAALGYPAAHRTPSLDDSRWIYWTNRFRTIAVEFDDKGLVKEDVN